MWPFNFTLLFWFIFLCCLVTKSCLTLCNPMDCSMTGFPVLHYHLEFAQAHVHWIHHQSVMPSNHLILCCPLLFLPSIFPSTGSFPVSQLFVSGGQSIGASASVSVLPINIMGWLPLGLIGFISLLSKELSRVFSGTTVQKHHFFGAQPSLWSNSHIHTMYIFN